MTSRRTYEAAHAALKVQPPRTASAPATRSSDGTASSNTCSRHSSSSRDTTRAAAGVSALPVQLQRQLQLQQFRFARRRVRLEQQELESEVESVSRTDSTSRSWRPNSRNSSSISRQEPLTAEAAALVSATETASQIPTRLRQRRGVNSIIQSQTVSPEIRLSA